MILIKKGNHILSVSKNAYESMFERMGYEIVNGEETKVEVSSPETKEDKEGTEKPKENDENQEIDNFLEDVSNLKGKEEKEPKNDSDSKEEEKKEEPVAKENNLGEILDMLTEKNKNRQQKSK